MSKLETKDAVEVLLSEKKKAEANLAKAYDSYCLLPNEHDQEDWDNYSALVTALEMALEALEKQTPKKPEKCIEYRNLFYLYCPTCDTKIGYGYDFCGAIKKYNDMKNCIHCGQAIDWTESE